MWSVGIMLYVLMCGYLPFNGENKAVLFNQIKVGTINFKHVEFNNVSKEVKDLISKILVVDPDQRLNAIDALKHPWFTKTEFNESNNGIKLDKKVLNRLCQFKGGSKLKKAAMIMLVKLEDQENINALHE